MTEEGPFRAAECTQLPTKISAFTACSLCTLSDMSTPDPVLLEIGSRRLATAYPHRPPTDRKPLWSWRMVWTQRGERKQRSLGRLVVAEVAEAMLGLWETIDPASIAEDRRRVRRVVDLCRVWYATLEDRPEDTRLSSRTLDIYSRACAYIRDTIGDRALSTLSSEDVRALAGAMAAPELRARTELKHRKAATRRGQTSGPRARGRGYGHRTINLTLTVLAMALKWGADEGYPVPKGLKPSRYEIRPKRGERKARYRDHTPTPAELQALVGSMRRSAIRLALVVGWRTGGRVSELGALTWGDVEAVPGGGFVRLSGKTGVRRVSVSPETLAFVLEHQPEDAGAQDLVFDEKFGRRGSSRLTAVQEARGVRKDRQFTFHGLRRRWCSDQIEAGVPVNVYADQSGHSPEIALKHYARVTDRERQAARLRVDERAGARDLYGFLAERGLAVEEAMELLDAALKERAARGHHLAALE